MRDVARVVGDAGQVQQGLVLDVAFDQGGGATGVDLKVALDLRVWIVGHLPVVVAGDVGLGDVVVVELHALAQHAVGVVVEHDHAADGLGRAALLAAHDLGHAGLHVGKRHGRLGDGQQLLQVAVELKDAERLAHVVEVVLGQPDLVGRDLVAVVLWDDHALLHDDLAAQRGLAVVHDLTPSAVDHALLVLQFVRHTVAKRGVVGLAPVPDVHGQGLVDHPRVHGPDDLVVDDDQHAEGDVGERVALGAGRQQLHLLGLNLAVVGPHLVGVLADLVTQDAALGHAHAGGGCTQHLADRLGVVARQTDQSAQLLAVDVAAQEEPATALVVVAAGRVEERVPRVPAHAGGHDRLVDLQHLRAVGLGNPHLAGLAGRERAVHDHGAQTHAVLDALAALAVEAALGQAVVD